MGLRAEQRRHSRMEVPIQIDLPRLAPGEMLEPKDVSMGGFMVEAEQRPVVWPESRCEIWIEKKVFRGNAVVAWAKESNDPSKPRWRAGLSFKMLEEGQREFAEVMEAIRRSLVKPPGSALSAARPRTSAASRRHAGRGRVARGRRSISIR